MVELGNERTELLEESDADGLKIRFRLAGSRFVALIFRADVLKIAIHSNGLWVSGDSPLRGAEKNADVSGIEAHHARRDGISFDGLIDSGKNNDVSCSVNDDAATSQIGDDFVLAALRERWSGSGSSENHQSAARTVDDGDVAKDEGNTRASKGYKGAEQSQK
jgi:hypothetical protein